MKTILFQGDSITDSGRNRENDNQRGYGYPTLVAGQLGTERPNEFRFLNRGISGDRVIDILARIKSDIINLAPDCMSILIGVNDVWHEYLTGNGVDEARYELYYDLILQQTLEAHPNVKIIILEPFVLKGPATEENWPVFRAEVEKRAAASRRIAEKYSLPLVPLMSIFDQALAQAPAGYWTEDGVHPTAMGHELIKRAWLKAFEGLGM